MQEGSSPWETANHRRANAHYPGWWGSDGYPPPGPSVPQGGLTFAALMTGVPAPGVTTSEWPAPSSRKQYWVLQYLQYLVGHEQFS
jgi:hypothetical protein